MGKATVGWILEGRGLKRLLKSWDSGRQGDYKETVPLGHEEETIGRRGRKERKGDRNG